MAGKYGKSKSYRAASRPNKGKSRRGMSKPNSQMDASKAVRGSSGGGKKK